VVYAYPIADAPDIKARRRLDRLGETLERVRREESAAMKAIPAAAADALKAGVTKAEIAERVGISRPTLNRLLPKN
jgi:transcriptional regulator with XRE-family HTH domain